MKEIAHLKEFVKDLYDLTDDYAKYSEDRLDYVDDLKWGLIQKVIDQVDDLISQITKHMSKVEGFIETGGKGLAAPIIDTIMLKSVKVSSLITGIEDLLDKLNQDNRLTIH